ncbi:glycosyltransferase family 4 protein [Halegenticoccus soli]|uniref:glycosyltransferase family 4 protein n=1 Tax=Halegenticoccus soli TaxID=1985678 RepID=UPI000C6CB8F2|nr:glycosyltransferase family 4 protein [Halegenticoccus soli]
MAEIAVVHPNLAIRGGAESVCMHALEALQSEHELTLFALDRPDLDALNEYFRTDVTDVRIELAGALGPRVREAAGHRLLKLQAALLGRYVRRREDEFDLVLSTKNEFAFETPSVQYVHSPQFAAADPGIDKVDPAHRAYDAACRTLAGIDVSSVRSAVLLANSEWTADVVEDVYGATAEVVYPPVNTSQFPSRPWEDREPGFLTIGRIGPSKRVLRNVEIIATLRERGHDVHLHVVGPTTDGEYCDQVRERADELGFVRVEGAVEHEHLLELIANHRYGLHGRPYEHFGIAVAELLAGGTIPFAPDSGGQREILAEDPRLLYNSPEEAVTKIDRVLSDPKLQREIRGRFQATKLPFTREAFKENIRNVVERVTT